MTPRLRVPSTKEQEMFAPLEQAASNATRAADLLDEMIHGYPGTRGLAREILLCEQEGDRLTEQLVEQVNQTFVTPIEREDLLALISRLDDIVDLAEEVADYIGLYGIQAARHDAKRLTRILLEAARLVERAVPKLRRMDDMSAEIVEIHRQENEGDRALREAMAALFNEQLDPLLVIGWKDLLERLEAAIDATESVADVLATIQIKNR